MSNYYDDDTIGITHKTQRGRSSSRKHSKESPKKLPKHILVHMEDAIEARIQYCLSEAESLLNSKHFGASLCLSATAIELMIRFMILRPLIQGAFLSDEWAEILANRIATGRTAEDRILLPAVLKVWGIDLLTLRTTADYLVWETVCKTIWPSRNNFVHKGDPLSSDLASMAIDCAICFRKEIVGSIALRLEFTLETTGRWCEIKGEKTYDTSSGLKGHSSWSQSFNPKDPFSQTEVET